MRTLPTKSQKSGGLRKNSIHVRRVSPLPLPEDELKQRCSVSGTPEQENNTTYNEQDNKLSVMIASTDKLLINTTHYAVRDNRTIRQVCGSEIGPTSPIRSSQPDRIAVFTPLLVRYAATPDGGRAPSQYYVPMYTSTNTQPKYTLDVCRVGHTYAKNTHPFPSEPVDGEDGVSGDSGRQRSSDSTSSNSSQRSRPSGRRPLGNRHHPYANSQGNDDDEDDDDRDPKPNRQKITTQCEANAAATEVTKPNKKKSRASLPSKLDTLGAISPIHRPNASLMSETSFFKLLGYARNWVAGNGNTTDIEVALDLTDDQVHKTSESGNSVYIPLVSPVAEDPPVVLVHTPKKEVHEGNCDEFKTPSSKYQQPQADAFYTGLGNPEITPVSRVTTRSMRVNLGLKSYLHTTPLSPQQRVQERLRSRSQSTSLTEKNTENRARRVSEGDVTCPADQMTTYKSTLSGRPQCKRRQIKTTGTHECDGNNFHVHNALVEDSGICKVSLETEIKAALQGISPPITPGQTKLSTTEIFWKPNLIEETPLAEPHSCSPSCANAESIDSLRSLLTAMNHYLTRFANHPVKFNGLRIAYSYDRTTRVPLKGLMKSLGGWPFAILHIGTKRDLSFTPLRFNPATEVTEVCDVCVDNYSFLTIPPASTENLHIFFAPENSKANTKSDQQVFIIPFYEELPDHGDMEENSPTDPSKTETSTAVAKENQEVKSTEAVGSKDKNTGSHGDAGWDDKHIEDIEDNTAIPEEKEKDEAKCEGEAGNSDEKDIRKEKEGKEEENSAISDDVEREFLKLERKVLSKNNHTATEGDGKVKRQADVNYQKGKRDKPSGKEKKQDCFDEKVPKLGMDAAIEAKDPKAETGDMPDINTATANADEQDPAKSITITSKFETVDEEYEKKGGEAAQSEEIELKTEEYNRNVNGSEGDKEKDQLSILKKVASQRHISDIKARARKKMKKFLSEAHCADIVNKNNATFAENCLKACDIFVPEKRSAVENRAELLEFIQAVKEGTEKAPKVLISLMVSKLSNSGVEEELQRMTISAPKSSKAKDRMKLVEEYLLQAHHGISAETSSATSLPFPDRTLFPDDSVNHTIKNIPPLLQDGQSDTTSDDEDWSDLDYQPPKKDVAPKRAKRANNSKSKKRCSLSTKHGAAKATISRNKEVKLKATAATETGFSKQDEVDKLSTALNMLQAKFVEQVDEHKKLMDSLLQAHREEKLKSEKLEKELLSQKHCLEIILAESSSSNKKRKESANPNAHQEIKHLKSDIDDLKSSLKDLVQRTINENLDNFNKRIDKNQLGLEKLRAANKKREKDSVAREKTQQVNDPNQKLPKAQQIFDSNELDQGVSICHKSKNREQVLNSVQPVAVNIIIKAEETLKGGPETCLPVMDKWDNRKLDINVNLRSPKLNVPPIAEKSSEANSAINNKSKFAKSDTQTITANYNLAKTNSTVGPGNDASLSWTHQDPNTIQKKETVKLTDHSRPPQRPAHHEAEAPFEKSSSANETDEPPATGRGSYRRHDDNARRSNVNDEATSRKNESETEASEQVRFSHRRSDPKSRRWNIHDRESTSLKEGETRRADNRRKNTSNAHQRRKCLLIHDSTFDGFNQEYFSNQFDVTTFPVKKASIAAKSQKLKDVIKQKVPECIYVHLGLHDIISSNVDTTLCHFEELRDFLVQSTKASICFSLVIPTTNSPNLNAKIEKLNRELSLMVSTARHDNGLLKDRLFTYDNSSVGWLNEKHDKNVLLTNRGKMIMWTKLNDGLRKTLRLPRPSLIHKNSSNTHQNSIQYG
ncbi:hypothetical protein ACHWQZ_G007789 [Mnemiopsis leidyi]